jgi:N-glycosidase YbiA
MSEKKVINFYSTRDEYGFSAHRIFLKDKVWKTTEHYFQAQKFAETSHEEELRLADSPMTVAKMGRDRKRPLRKDWEKVKDEIMMDALRAKFTQHKNLQEILLGTDEAILVEHTKNDFYWADGGDGSGKNMLGVLLMKLREELRNKS